MLDLDTRCSAGLLSLISGPPSCLHMDAESDEGQGETTWTSSLRILRNDDVLIRMTGGYLRTLGSKVRLRTRLSPFELHIRRTVVATIECLMVLIAVSMAYNCLSGPLRSLNHQSALRQQAIADALHHVMPQQ